PTHGRPRRDCHVLTSHFTSFSSLSNLSILTDICGSLWQGPGLGRHPRHGYRIRNPY
ncbi:hypothetical protein V3C99_003041, partial [Haemonchus contortus]